LKTKAQSLILPGVTDSKRELHASPQRLAKDSERNLIETFRNCEEYPGKQFEGA